jgi:hypothetical protein
LGESVLRALIIAEPWIGAILAGTKTWEMRAKKVHIRGRVGLIRKGTGHVVGVADVVNCLAPIGTPKAYADAERFHGVPQDFQAEAIKREWLRPWVLESAIKLRRPVPYDHRKGQQDWVTLDPDVEADVLGQLK